MSIRKATVEDVDAIISLLLGSGESGRESDFNEDGWNQFLELMQPGPVLARLQDSKLLTLCFIEDEEMVGLITIKNFEAIYQLFVSPEKWRRGIAIQLWNEAKAICMENGSKGFFRVKSSTMAVPVYESFGFVVTGKRTSLDGVSFTPMEYCASRQD